MIDNFLLPDNDLGPVFGGLVPVWEESPRVSVIGLEYEWSAHLPQGTDDSEKTPVPPEPIPDGSTAGAKPGAMRRRAARSRSSVRTQLRVFLPSVAEKMARRLSRRRRGPR